jgi:hypothetical protein
MAEQRREWTIGTHRAWLESPDVLVVKYDGDVHLADAQRVMDIFQEVGSQTPFHVLVHFGEAKLDKDARDHMMHHARAEWFKGIVGVGGTMVHRAISKAMMVALYITGKWTIESDFVETEEQARAALTRQRAKRLNTAA